MTPESPIRVTVTDHLNIDGVSIAIGLKLDHDNIRVMHFGGNGLPVWEDQQIFVDVEPTMRLSHDFARALLDALLRYYQGSGDYHTLRADYIHERDRVDKMIDALIGISMSERN